jgi:hypothetical protein
MHCLQTGFPASHLSLRCIGVKRGNTCPDQTTAKFDRKMDLKAVDVPFCKQDRRYLCARDPSRWRTRTRTILRTLCVCFWRTRGGTQEMEKGSRCRMARGRGTWTWWSERAKRTEEQSEGLDISCCVGCRVLSQATKREGYISGTVRHVSV